MREDQDFRSQDRYDRQEANTPAQNWWEGPPPPGYSGPWPPPLGPGDQYGPNFGQVVFAQGVTTDDRPRETETNPEYFGQQATPPAPTMAPSPAQTNNPYQTAYPAQQANPTVGSLLQPWTGSFQAPSGPPDLSWMPQLPQFKAPEYTPPPAFEGPQFKQPTFQDALSDPGYDFAAREGIGRMQNSGAARGVVNGGGSLKDIAKWAGDFAQTRYNDVYGRALKTHETNYNDELNKYATNTQTQNLDPYKFKYQGAMDEFTPKLLGYSTMAAAGQRQNENNYNDAWNSYLQKYREFSENRDSVFDKLFKQSQLGLGAT